jgi:hypothetical protein
VFAFLADLRNHWRLSRRFAALDTLDSDLAGGQVRIRGPLGLSRLARTRVLEAEEPRRLAGRADIGRETVGAVRWEIEPNGSGSRVTLSAFVESASPLDRAVLALGGRRWLERVFREALDQLGRVA